MGRNKTAARKTRTRSAADTMSQDGAEPNETRNATSPGTHKGEAVAHRLEQYARAPLPQRSPNGRTHTSPAPATNAGTTEAPSVTHGPTAPTQNVHSSEPTLTEVLNTITGNHTVLITRIDELKTEFTILKHDVQKIRERTGEAERRIVELEDNMNPLPGCITNTEKQIQALEAKADDLENWLRRSAPEKFIEQWLTNTFGQTAFSAAFTVERAHRIPGRPPPPGAPARPLIARLLNYRARDAALAEAGKAGDITFENQKVSIYPDFSAEVRKTRAKFTEVKQQLRQRRIPYAMIFPARLRITDNGKTHFFNTPEETTAWLETRPRNSPNRDPQ
ncbi:hypothetical protein XENTR_v10024258 [Xenopus tropicalis]|nr:hypothetical protein XENTR_v10024258 [Xenopus tropicalis]